MHKEKMFMKYTNFTNCFYYSTGIFANIIAHTNKHIIGR